MAPVTKRRLMFWTPFAVLLAAGFAWTFQPEPVPVDLVSVERGTMRVTVDEDGKTRIRDVFVVSAPIAGVKRRILHKAGDSVTANETVVTSIVPTDPDFLDPRSEGVIQAGTELVEIGDPGNLEIVVDLLSSDAVRVAPGQEVIIDDWGGDHPITGRVRRIEPYGFTKVSALGIEEQRVNVMVDIETPRQQWQSLGHGFRVETRIILWQSDDVLKVPLTALFRQSDDWAVFKVENGTAHTRIVETGRRDGVEAQITGGLEEGDQIVLHPSGRIGDGTKVEKRIAQ